MQRDHGVRPTGQWHRVGFADPDGNTWAAKQLKARGEKPLTPLDHRGRFGSD